MLPVASNVLRPPVSRTAEEYRQVNTDAKPSCWRIVRVAAYSLFPDPALIAYRINRPLSSK